MSNIHAVHPEAPRPGVQYMPVSLRIRVGTGIGLLALGWVLHHIAVIAGLIEYGAVYIVSFTVLFGMMAIPLVLSWFERPYRGTPSPNTRIGVVIPVYNEHEDIFHRVLYSMIDQKRLPNLVVVIDDGTHSDEDEAYAKLRNRWIRDALKKGVDAHWIVQQNQGKRRAQVTGFEVCRETGFGTSPDDIIVTVDSDSVLDYGALDEGVKPFALSEVQSVGGINVGINAEHNFLTRLSDLLHIQWQLVTKSAQNVFGSITVNSGRLAFYRAAVCIENIEPYLNERFLGRPVVYSDDSLLTMFAIARGKAVQQPTAITFTWHPEEVSFLLRQRLRWMRGWFIRSFWRFRYLPMNSYAFWSEVMDAVRLSLGTVVAITVFVIRPAFMDGAIVWQLFLLPLLISYTTSLRYFSVRRDDQPVGQQLLTYAMSPVVLVWCWFILRPMRLYAMATCYRTGWSTRAQIEVSHTPIQIGHAEQSLRRFTQT